MPAIACPKCGAEAELRDNSAIYSGVSYGLAYICGNFPRCDTYVGAHRRTLLPLGTLADRETRRLRQTCHNRFDGMWKFGQRSRKAAYAWLARAMNLSKQEAHIGMFDAAKCRTLLAILDATGVDGLDA